MFDPPNPTQDPGTERFTYFMVRVHSRAEVGADHPSGVVERLGSGWKKRFSGADELLGFLTDGPTARALEDA